MKRWLLTLCFIMMGVVAAMAQQGQVEHRSKSLFVFPEFKEAVVQQTFGRKIKAKANIYLGEGTLIYIDAKTGKKMRAYLSNIVGVTFDDTIRYMRVDSVMARVVAQRGYNILLRHTSVDKNRLHDEQVRDLNFEMSGIIYLDKRDDEQGYPLTDRYYFIVRGETIPANESAFKRFVGKDQKQAFKVLMGNRFWSWKDPESLMMLFDFLPK